MKHHEELLAMLRDQVRQDRSKLEEWERVARGEVDRTEIEALANDPASQAMLAACTPLGDDAAARIEARIERERSVAPPKAQAEVEAAGGKVIALVRAAKTRPSPFVRVARIAGPLAAAAAVVLALRMNAREDGALPAYAITAGGGAALVRGESQAGDRLTIMGAPDETFDIVVRPATAVSKGTNVHGYAFVMASDVAHARALAARIEIAPGGSIRLQGQVESLGAADEIRVVVSAHPLDARAALAVATANATANGAPVNAGSARVLRIALDRR